jgi:hypothetical protein
MNRCSLSSLGRRFTQRLRLLIAGVSAGILAEILIEHPFWWLERRTRLIENRMAGIMRLWVSRFNASIQEEVS